MLERYSFPQKFPGSRAVVYFVAISSNLQLPNPLDQTFNAASASPLVRLEPVDSVNRIVEDHIGDSRFLNDELGYFTGDTLLGTQPDGVRQILPDQDRIFDVAVNAKTTKTVPLDTHVVPFSLEDVQLFVSTSTRVHSVNPFDGAEWYELTTGTNIVDVDMRVDGRLFVLRQDTTADNSTSGIIDEIEVGSGDRLNFNDGLGPDAATVGALVFRRETSATDYEYLISEGSSIIGDTDLPTNTGNGTRSRGSQSNTTGLTTGLAYDGDGSGTLYGVTSGGDFYRVEGGGGTVLRNFGVSFSGLTLGPQNVESGRFASLFFATTTTNDLQVIDPTDPLGDGSFRPTNFVFDTNNDGLADSYVRRMTGLVGSATGLAFSRLDFNLWHPTERRDVDLGHGYEATFDGTRDQSVDISNVSFYFGFERDDNPVNQSYLTGYGFGGQLGVRTNFFQDELTFGDNSIGNNYNLPGGAQGTLESTAFSLEGYSRTDKPTLYFNYYLNTQAANSPTGQMLDSARVFASRDNGASWEMLATNNSSPTYIFTPDVPNSELPTYQTVSRDAFPSRRTRRFKNCSISTNPVPQMSGAKHVWTWRISLASRTCDCDSTLVRAGAITDDFGMPGDINGQGFSDVDRARENDHEGFYVDDFIIGFAERGEMVTGPSDQRSNNDFFALQQNPTFAASPQSLIGPYQLEIRRGTEYIGNDVIKFDFNDPGNPVWIGEPLSPIETTTAPGGPTNVGHNTKILTTFDTNERLADGVTMNIPFGASIIDGEAFTVGDGIKKYMFEFDRNGATTSGNIRIPINGTETKGQAAKLVADAINARADLDVSASVQSVTANSGLVHLQGAVDLVVGQGSSEKLTIEIAGVTVAEGASTIATLTRTGDLSAPLTVTLSATDLVGVLTTELELSDGVAATGATISLTIPANSSLVVFNLNALDDLRGSPCR